MATFEDDMKKGKAEVEEKELQVYSSKDKHFLSFAEEIIEIIRRDDNLELEIIINNGYLNVEFSYKVPNIESTHEMSLLQIAAYHNAMKCAKSLIHHGLNVSDSNIGHWSSLHYAVLGNHLEMCKLLIEQQPKVSQITLAFFPGSLFYGDHVTSHNYTPLHIAAANGHLDIVKFLLEGNLCRVNAKSNDGSTPIHLAMTENKIDVVQYLLNGSWIDKIGYDKSLDLETAVYLWEENTLRLDLCDAKLIQLHNLRVESISYQLDINQNDTIDQNLAGADIIFDISLG